MLWSRNALAGAVFLMVSVFFPSLAPAKTGPVIAAASSMQFALADIAAVFTRETGQNLRFSFGSSGNFARQIRSGAPFELFIAADEDIILDLHRDGFVEDEGDVYAVGRLVLVAPHGSPLAPDRGLDGVAAMLEAGQISRFAIANPDHAPYGIRARQALEARDIWKALQPFLVLGENVTQAAQFALSGNAEGGLTAYSLMLSADIAPRGTYALIPETAHGPLRPRMVLLPDASNTAIAFRDFMYGGAARAILKTYGFTLPEGY